MSKIARIAEYEYLAAVKSKAFIIGVILMPVFMGGAIIVHAIMKKAGDVTPRKLAVIDRTGRIYPAIEAAAKERNANDIFETDKSGQRGKQVRPTFVPELVTVQAGSESDLELKLSERIRKEDLFAFVIIGADVIAAQGSDNAIEYHSQSPTFRELPNWLDGLVNEEVKRRRFVDSGVDQAKIMQLSARVPFRRLGLTSVGEEGKPRRQGEGTGEIQIGVAAASMFLLFMIVMMSTPQMLNNVLEEKMQKIAEFLVSAVSPFQLMMGKLLSIVMVAMTLCVLYLGAIYYVTVHYEVNQFVPGSAYAWFLLFTTLSLVIFGSMFTAIGAACSEIRDAQSLMLPIMLPVVIPVMCWVQVVEAPNGVIAHTLSLFPPTAPMILMLRMGLSPSPAAWELAAGIAVSLAFAVACVWGGGRVFRIGILAQGQTPSFTKLVKWIFTS